MNIGNIGDLILLLSLFISLYLFAKMVIKSTNNYNAPINKNAKLPNICILIPARDESNVIENLLNSIDNQTYPVLMKDVYIIIEDEKDLTKTIGENYGANVIIRKNTELKRKGYALDELVKNILERNKKYDMYFIFDADNILDKDYFKEMIKTYEEGYDIGIGYRNTQNGNTNAISASSSLTFSMINTIGNKFNNRYNINSTISGTGFYIKGSIIENLNGYPFNTLTEDYELTLYSVLNNLKSYYNDKAIFYDEQPTNFKVSITQRIRWVKGFFEARKLYIKKINDSIKVSINNLGSKYIYKIGILPYLIIVIGIIINILCKLINSIITGNFTNLLVTILIIYLILVLITGIMLYLEKGKINLNTNSKIKALLFNPIFLASYIYCAIYVIFNKEIEWKKIEHKGK